MERWDWGDIVNEGPWLETPEVYRSYVGKMQYPWVSIQFCENSSLTSEMKLQYVSERMISSGIWDRVDERLRFFGCTDSSASINFYVTARTNNSCKSLLLVKAQQQRQKDCFLIIRITDKPKLAEVVGRVFRSCLKSLHGCRKRVVY
jgi:hypothetical protein